MSMYDKEHSIAMKATVTNFDWASPHTVISFDVQDDNGNVERWTAESPAPFRLARNGWSKDSLKPGDQVTIVGNRKKDGSTTMRLLKLVRSNGEQLEGYR
jgi:hypothetical protein